MPYVGPEGPLNASIAIVGEKPGRYEVTANRPFVGPSGRELGELLLKIGINRSQVYITNAVKNVNNFDNPTTNEIRAEFSTLIRELSRLKNLKVIIAMGASALRALTAFQIDSITSYRGSILPSLIPGVKLVPTFHPAFYMRGEWRFKPVVRFDLARALEESYDNTLRYPERNYYVASTRQDLSDLREHFTSSKFISFDIELLRGRFIECISFSSNPKEAYCIPITDGKRQNYWASTVDELFAWRTINSILNQKETHYVTQNGLFDCWHLWRHGISTPYMAAGYDTMLMHRLRAPDLPHDLGFLVSIYTREPYYKDESGDWKTQTRTVSDNQFYGYNCKDAACTLEVCFELMKDLKKHEMLDYYRTEIQAQWPIVAEMRQVGLHVDRAALAAVKSKLSLQLVEIQSKIKGILGWQPNTRSPLDMEKFYNQLSIKYTRTATGKPKRDIEQLYTHAYNYPHHRNLLYNVADLNRRQTLLSTFVEIPLDSNDYYHPSLDPTKTKTGRLASKGADEGGPQIQNIPHSMRSVFIPDNPETDEFTQADLAGAEAVMLAYYSRDPLLIQCFEKGKKVHAVRGCVIYRGWNNLYELPPDSMIKTIKKVCIACAADGEAECSHSEYFMAKKNGHAFAYKQGIRRSARELRKIGIFVDEKELQRIRDLVVTPPIQLNFQQSTEMELRRSAWLQLPLGRKREFYGQLDEEMLRAALSWKCQGTVGQITNRAMIKLFCRCQKLAVPRPRIITQTHDSLLISHHKSLRSLVCDELQAAFTQSITIGEFSFTIPIELAHGPNWRDLK